MRMIEKVARAIARKHHDVDRDGIFPDSKTLDWAADQTWKLHVGSAIAAIEAMREPTDNMRHNAQPMYDDPCSVSGIWDTMIATALSEAPHAND